MQDFLPRKILIPFYLKSRGLNRIKYLKRLEKNNILTLEELQQTQWEKLKLLVNHCYANIPYYRELFKKLDIHPEDIKSIQDFSRIPELTKSQVSNYYDKLIYPKLSEKEICYDSTSGSTGIPLKLARSREDQEYGFALRYRSNAWCGWEYWQKSVWLVSDTRHITQLDRMKGRVSLSILGRLLINTKNITRENMFEWTKQIKAFKPRQVYGYSSLLAEFSEFLLENNIQIDGIEGVYSTAEILRKRKVISSAFNAPVYDQYGASEIPCIAHECKNGKMHLNIDEILVEFIDIAENSDIKKMICTPLYLYGMPLLRYELKDTAIPTEERCDCGLPYPVIELKVGRISDNLLSSSGKLVSGITLSWYITDATQGIKQYQIIQENLNSLIIKIVDDEDHRIENEIAIRCLLLEMLNTKDIKIKFEYINEILPGKNGKYRPIISKIIENPNKPYLQTSALSGY